MTYTFRNLYPESKRTMSLGLSLPMADKSAFGGTPHWRDLKEMAQIAEQIGLDGLSVVDHYVYRSADPSTVRGFWEAGTIATALAASTTTMQISIMVAGNPFRHPIHLAKVAETISDVSSGRFILGLAAGANTPDFEMVGFPYDTRSSRAREALAIISPFLKQGHVDIQGTYYQANDAYNRPLANSPYEGGVPLLVGARAPKMGKLGAELADGFYTGWQATPDALTGVIEQIAGFAEAAERDPRTLFIATGSHVAMEGYLGFRPNPLTGEPEAIAEQIRAFSDAGAHHFLISPDPCTPKTVADLANILEFLDA